MFPNCPVLQAECMLKSTPRVNQSGAEGVSELTLQELFDLEETPLLRYTRSAGDHVALKTETRSNLSIPQTR